MISRRKYHRGRILSQVWLFGGVERVSKKKFVIPLTGPRGDKRDKETLIPLIKKYIRPGSIIYSDAWGAYRELNTHGYSHHVINHSENFVNGTIHTQNIERVWRDIKEWIKRPGMRSKYLEQYLARYLLIQSVTDKKLLLHVFSQKLPNCITHYPNFLLYLRSPNIAPYIYSACPVSQELQSAIHKQPFWGLSFSLLAVPLLRSL